MLVRNPHPLRRLGLMKRESRLGRMLWSALLVLLAGYVVTDFVRSPFSTSPGAAAVRPTAVTIWSPGADAGGEDGKVLDAVAAGLELDCHTTAVKTIPGGSAQGLISFLSRPAKGHGQLLAITSATLADLAYERHETLVPGVAEEAVLARALLRRSRPIAILADDPLAIGVERGSPIRNGDELVASLAAEPDEQLFGIGDDNYSRDELAALVAGAGVDGEIRFTVLQSNGEVGQALESGAAHTVLATRSTLRPEVAAGRLREIGWPLAGGAPRSWIALIARPGTPHGQVHRLRRWVATVEAEAGWRSKLRHEGRRPLVPHVKALARMIRDPGPAEALERVAEEVEHR
jgi:hypothetical protein